MPGNGLNLTLVINSELEQNVNFFVGISDFRRHDPTPWSHQAHSLQIRFAIWRYESQALVEETSGKIPRDQTNLQISRNSKLNTRRAQKRFKV